MERPIFNTEIMYSKKSTCRRSVAIIGGNDDLLTEILLYLPAKSLIRFQSASKHWYSLISSPYFSHLHTLNHRSRRHDSDHLHRHAVSLTRHRRYRFCLKDGHKHCHHEARPSFLLRSISSQCFIFLPTLKKLVPFHLGFSEFAYQRILQSCNGLLLLECRNSLYGRKDYFICNPTTMKSRKLLLRDGFSGLCLVFNPSKSPHYKVLCFRENDDSGWFEVYDSETHTWKEKGGTSKEHSKIFKGVYFNDDIYFIRPHGTSFCFCLEDDRFYAIRKIPRVRTPGSKKNYIMESNGHLHHVVLSLQEDNTDLCICESNNEVSGWFEKYRCNLNQISAKFGGNKGRAISLLGMIRGEMEKDSLLLFHVPGKIMVYRFLDKIFEVVVDFTRENYFEEGQLQFEFKDAHRFIDTLALV